MEATCLIGLLMDRLGMLTVHNTIYRDERKQQERRNVQVHDAKRHYSTLTGVVISWSGESQSHAKRDERERNGPLLPAVCKARWGCLYAQ